MSIYDRIKTLLEVSGRDNPGLMGRISAKHARKANRENNFDLKSPDRKLAKKYNKKQDALIGKDLESSYKPSRFPGSSGRRQKSL